MALKTQDIPRPTWELFCGSWVVGGDRDALILGSTGGDSEDPDVSFRFDAELTEDDRRKLSNQGVPEECCDDLSIFRARAKLDKTYHLVGEEVSKPGRELDRSYILGRVEDLMKNSDKPGGETSVQDIVTLTLIYQYLLSTSALSQLLFIILVMVRKTQVIGVSKMGTSPSKTLLSYTIGFVRALSSLL